MSAPTPLELLAPARNIETAIAAINCGADAVYIGGPHHGARAAAGNSIDDIRSLCQYAHRFRVRVYVTFNTLIYEDELAEARQAVCQLYEAGVDALIVQDMSLLRMDLPPIALHASTQCDTRTAARAKFLEDSGMSCIVLPREMTLDEIRAVRAATTVRLEAFVHGALCVCYSGDCQASAVNGGRSANRGECAQICRLPYDLCDRNGQTLITDRHLLSLRDMNRLADLEALADAGIQSFKIEGRLKDTAYVMNTVRTYSQALDALCAAHPERYRRASYGKSTADFQADVNKTFNRGFTPYFLHNAKPGKGMLGSHLTPKFTGAPIGKVLSVKGRQITIKATAELHNGDGLGYFDSNNKFNGFRVNRINGNTIHTASEVRVAPGTTLYRNADKAFDDALAAARPERLIDVSFTLRATATGLALDASDGRGCRASAAIDISAEPSRSPQQQARRDLLSRLGGSIYRMAEVTDLLGDVFIPAKQLTALRRNALDALDHTAAATLPLELRRGEDASALFPAQSLDYHGNVANSLAEKFYREHGVREIDKALEVAGIPRGEVRVMTTRYCLRRELGACLREENAAALPSPLFLKARRAQNGMRVLRLDFDCKNCRMFVNAMPADFQLP